ncbi:MAG: DNA topoisomerase IV subunit B [Mycoplasmoidaceae bacterium]
MNYSDSSIKVLKGLDPVRKRPGMYIGSTDQKGLHHLVWEIIDNAIDEVMAGFANNISIVINEDESISIADNGRGIPTGINKTTKKSTVDTVFTELHAGGKFDGNAYQNAGGLHGVGASVVNALSKWLVVEVMRDKMLFSASYQNGGNIKDPLKQIGSTNKTGTKVTFLPDPFIFSSTKFKYSLIRERVQESSFLFKGLKISLESKIENIKEEFFAKNGIIEYLDFLNKDKISISKVIYFCATIDLIDVEIAIQYTNDASEVVVSFANSIKTIEGGSHEIGFKVGLAEVINDFARKYKILNQKDPNFENGDVREGLSSIVSVKIPESLISYEGQTKNKLYTSQAFSAVKKITITKLTLWLTENKKAAMHIINKAKRAMDARMAAKKAREEVRQIKGTKKERLLSGKLTPCQSKGIQTELFLVEGDSAGGTAKLARDRKNQAILPLKGKIINVEKASIKDILNNEEINTIISSIGASIAADFNLNRAKYGKIIIMTDADTDGSHIQILLLTFFYRYMKPLIESGRVYIAQPPLYKISSNKKFIYLWDEFELNEYKAKWTNYQIQRYKGLGEMNSDQLWETTMNPKTRKIIQVKINDVVLAEKRICTLMGDNTTIRKEWISNNINFDME